MILVTGGAGYIGSHVNKLLKSEGYETVVLDNLYSGHRELVNQSHLIEGDVGNESLLKQIFATYPIETVCHLAAFTEVDESVVHPQRYYQNNVQSTLTLLNTMLQFNIKSFIFSSTSAVYSDSFDLITEATPIEPLSPYGRSKWFVDQILHDYNLGYGLNYVSFRYFNAAGAALDSDIGEWHDPETHLIPVLFEVGARKRDHFSIFGTDYGTPDGTCIRDYIHVLDIARAHLLALQRLSAGNFTGVFNLGYGAGFSVREILNRVQYVTQRCIKTVESPRRAGDASQSVASSEKARAELGWVPKYNDLDLIIESAWNWYKRSLIKQ
jgi:UDP-glucose 4-epimerase